MPTPQNSSDHSSKASSMRASHPRLASLFSNWYSGATLFTILLNNHSQIVSNGETMLFDNTDNERYECTCGQFLDNCEFYRSTAMHMRLPDASGWDKSLFVQVPCFTKTPILKAILNSTRFEGSLKDNLIGMIPTCRDIRKRFLAAQLNFFANARKYAGASIYLDGTKSIRRAQLFASDGRSDMRILHFIRDGRGFCASYLRNQGPNTRLTDAANAWSRYISRVDGFSKVLASIPVLTIRYEDLCRSPADTIGTVCAFLQIPYQELDNVPHKDMHILGNRMRKSFGGAIVEDTSWKQNLDRRAQSALTSLMRRDLQRFGYL